MKRYFLKIASILYLFSSIPAHAMTCEGNVSYIDIEASDYVKIDIGYGQWVVCRLATNYAVTSSAYGTYNIPPETCQGLLSQLTTAKAQHVKVKANIWGSGPCPANLPASEYAYAWIFPE